MDAIRILLRLSRYLLLVQAAWLVWLAADIDLNPLGDDVVDLGMRIWCVLTAGLFVTLFFVPEDDDEGRSELDRGRRPGGVAGDDHDENLRHPG